MRHDARALLALGSIGRERSRLDDHSDLDFFVIVEEGAQNRYLNDLSWLAVRPVVFSYRNTVDGHKALFDDDVLCEFAVFAPSQLASIPYAPGRIVWQREGFDARFEMPALPLPAVERPSTEWLLGELLTSLFTGLSRFRRGERVAAFRAVQVHAVDRLLQLLDATRASDDATRDPFARERRFERRHPAVGSLLSDVMRGYDATPQSALALLSWVESRYDVNRAIAAAIRRLV